MQQEKNTLRREMRKRLAGISADWREEISRDIVAKVVITQSWLNAQVIGIFSGRADEIDTKFFWASEAIQGKTLACPKMSGEDLIFIETQNPGARQPGPWGVLEPVGNAEVIPDLLIVPGLAFDVQGNRLGRGRGYYDRFLKQHPSLITLGICFDFQIVKSVPCESHDIPMSTIISNQP